MAKDNLTLNLCDCKCHKNPKMKHVSACCSECSHCSARIRTGRMEDHIQLEHPEKNDGGIKSWEMVEGE